MKRIVLFATMALMFSPMCASAMVGAQGNAQVAITVPHIIEISMDSTAQTVENSVSVSDMQNGYKEGIDGGYLTVSTNDEWALSVRSEFSTFYGTGDNSKAVGNLSVSIDGNSYQALNDVYNVSLIGYSGPEIGGEHSIRYRFTCNSFDNPGSYVANLVYTVSNPL